MDDFIHGFGGMLVLGIILLLLKYVMVPLIVLTLIGYMDRPTPLPYKPYVAGSYSERAEKRRIIEEADRAESRRFWQEIAAARAKP